VTCDASCPICATAAWLRLYYPSDSIFLSPVYLMGLLHVLKVITSQWEGPSSTSQYWGYT